jgi:CBS-domain-containing membrane protein
MLTAKDIMTKNVTTVGAATTIEELARILMEHKISGTPVVDDNENLIGIVTENDLISRDKRLHIPTVMRLFDSFIMLESPGKIEKEIKRMTAVTVNDIYTKEAITVTEGTPVQDIATIMSEKKVHLIPVVEGKNEKKIIGIIGKIDLIRGIIRPSESA